MRIALATCAEYAQGIDEEQELARLLGADWVVWDDPAVAWEAYDRVVVRSTWDCSARPEAFAAWFFALPDVRNPAEVLRFGLDKAYLGELAEAGLPVVATTFLAPGAPALDVVADVAEVVVKPSVGSGARGAGRFLARDADAIAGHVAALHAAGRTAMVQPYLSAVDVHGEVALLYAGGSFSHAGAKAALLQPGRVGSATGVSHPGLRRHEPGGAERELADAVVAWVGERFGGPPAYARVDLVQDDLGLPVVLELELVEPNLFLGVAPEAAERFAAALRG